MWLESGLQQWEWYEVHTQILDIFKDITQKISEYSQDMRGEREIKDVSKDFELSKQKN